MPCALTNYKIIQNFALTRTDLFRQLGGQMNGFEMGVKLEGTRILMKGGMVQAV